MRFKPLELAHRISCPLLVIGAEEDQTSPYEEFIRIYDRAPDPKKLVTLPNVSHYTMYAKENIDKLVLPLVGWFKEWLPAR